MAVVKICRKNKVKLFTMSKTKSNVVICQHLRNKTREDLPDHGKKFTQPHKGQYQECKKLVIIELK